MQEDFDKLNKKIKLFVFGTLRQKQPNHYMLGLNSTYAGIGVLQGFKMHDLGSFPAIVPSDTEHKIVGEIYEVHETKLLERIDDMERSAGFTRWIGKVTDTFGHEHTCYFYVFSNKEVAEMLEEVENGDWSSHNKR